MELYEPDDKLSSFDKCKLYIMTNFPDEPNEIQHKMALAVYLLNKDFNTLVIPTVVNKIFKPSLN